MPASFTIGLIPQAAKKARPTSSNSDRSLPTSKISQSSNTDPSVEAAADKKSGSSSKQAMQHPAQSSHESIQELERIQVKYPHSYSYDPSNQAVNEHKGSRQSDLGGEGIESPRGYCNLEDDIHFHSLVETRASLS